MGRAPPTNPVSRGCPTSWSLPDRDTPEGEATTAQPSGPAAAECDTTIDDFVSKAVGEGLPPEGLRRFLEAAAVKESALPVPTIPRPKVPESRSPRCKKRFRHRLQVWRSACGLIAVVNQLDAGAIGRRTTKRVAASPSPLSSAAWMRTHALALREAVRSERSRRVLPTSGQRSSSKSKLATAAYGERRANDTPHQILIPEAVTSRLTTPWCPCFIA